jgi:hypothetical protein
MSALLGPEVCFFCAEDFFSSLPRWDSERIQRQSAGFWEAEVSEFQQTLHSTCQPCAVTVRVRRSSSLRVFPLGGIDLISREKDVQLHTLQLSYPNQR